MVKKRYSALAVALTLCVAASSTVQAETTWPRASSARETFAGPYDLLVAGTADRNSLGMILASMGLMALIAHRRRMPS